MLAGEFESMKALSDTAQEFVPRPYVWGKLNTIMGGDDSENPGTATDWYFLQMDIVEMQITDQPGGLDPDPVQLCSELVALHREASPLEAYSDSTSTHSGGTCPRWSGGREPGRQPLSKSCGVLSRRTRRRTESGWTWERSLSRR